MLSLLGWIVCGLVVGLIARAIVPGRQGLGVLMTIVLGVVGAFVGGLIASALGLAADPRTDPDASRMWAGWLFSILGAVIVLWGYVALSRRSDAGTRPLGSGL